MDKLEPSTVSSIDIPNDLDREILRVLMVEDSAEDSDLIMDTLIKGSGSDAEYLRVDTASEMRLALDQGEWDVILSDHNLPNFPTQEALKVWQDSGHGIPAHHRLKSYRRRGRCCIDEGRCARFCDQREYGPSGPCGPEKLTRDPNA